VKINEFVWTEDRIEHISRHAIEPEEFEEVCFGRPLVRRAKATGRNPLYQVLGRTDAGRLLFCVVVQFADGRGFPVTARPMTRREEQRFLQLARRQDRR
jgi:uncharacterized DUF497 family protein